MKIISDNLRMCRLQSIIDQAPHADTAAQARELMEKLKPKPEFFETDDYATMPQVEIGKGEL